MTTLHAALLTPLTGPLGLYGKTPATALTLWARKAAQLPAPWTGVEVEMHNTADNLHKAVHALLETPERPGNDAV